MSLTSCFKELFYDFVDSYQLMTLFWSLLFYFYDLDLIHSFLNFHIFIIRTKQSIELRMMLEYIKFPYTSW